MKTYAPGFYPIQVSTTLSTSYCIVTVIDMTREMTRRSGGASSISVKMSSAIGLVTQQQVFASHIFEHWNQMPNPLAGRLMMEKKRPRMIHPIFHPRNLRMNQSTMEKKRRWMIHAIFGLLRTSQRYCHRPLGNAPNRLQTVSPLLPNRPVCLIDSWHWTRFIALFKSTRSASAALILIPKIAMVERPRDFA